MRGGGIGAGGELSRCHTMAIGEDMHIAGLWRIKFGEAGPSECPGNQI
jgi:hypothetical protein